MSCDWNIKCLDCDTILRFCDANHQDLLMATLIKHADVIAGIAPLFDDTPCDIELRTSYGSVDTRWFAQHKGHHLSPIDEYGALMTDCPEYVDCACGSRRRCRLIVGHEGDHNPVSPSE